MNNTIAYLIAEFTKISQQCNIPSLFHVHIVPLNYFAQSWLELNQPAFNNSNYDNDRNIVCNQIHKYIVHLINNISSYPVSTNMLEMFSEIVINYMDNISMNEVQFNELSNIFNKMNITYQVPDNFIDSFSRVVI